LPPRAGPGLLRKVFGGWRVSQIAGFRSGFPFPVIAGGSHADLAPLNVAQLLRNRPDLRNGAAPWLAEPRRPADRLRPTGVKDETFGVLWGTARTEVDRTTRTVQLEDVNVTKVNFPTLAGNGQAST
jgi:hypothetical protein